MRRQPVLGHRAERGLDDETRCVEHSSAGDAQKLPKLAPGQLDFERASFELRSATIQIPARE